MFSQSMLDNMSVMDMVHRIKRCANEVETLIGHNTNEALVYIEAIQMLSNQLNEVVTEYLED